MIGAGGMAGKHVRVLKVLEDVKVVQRSFVSFLGVGLLKFIAFTDIH